MDFLNSVSECKAEEALFDKKSVLMMDIRDVIKKKKLTQIDAAKIIGCTQSRVSRIAKGHIDEFSYDWLFVAKEKLLNK